LALEPEWRKVYGIIEKFEVRSNLNAPHLGGSPTGEGYDSPVVDGHSSAAYQNKYTRGYRE
jgi:hypothetical protein